MLGIGFQTVWAAILGGKRELLLADEIGLAGDPEAAPKRIVAACVWRASVLRRYGNILGQETIQEARKQNEEECPQTSYGARQRREVSTKSDA